MRANYARLIAQTAENRIMKIGETRTTLFLYLTTLCVIANSASMWEHTTTSPLYGAKLGVFLMALCAVQIIVNGKISMTRNSSLALIVLCIVYLIYALITRYELKLFVTTYVLQFVIMFFYASSLYANNQLRHFFEVYSSVIVIIAGISLFFWLFGSILNIIPGKEMQYYWADSYKSTYSWLGLYYENPIQNIGQPVVRNVGIFTEAPAFSGQILYAMIIETAFIFENKHNHLLPELIHNKRFSRMILLSLTVLSTLSTKGLIGLMIIWAFLIVFLRCQTTAQLLLKQGTITGGLYTATVLCSILITQKLGTGSGAMRADDMVSAMKVWNDNPFFGAGYMNYEAIYQYQNVVRDNGGLSMGLVLILAWGGLCFFSIYLIASLRVRKAPFFRNNRLSWLMVVTLLTYNLFISNCGFSNAYIFLLATAYATPTGLYRSNCAQKKRDGLLIWDGRT